MTNERTTGEVTAGIYQAKTSPMKNNLDIDEQPRERPWYQMSKKCFVFILFPYAVVLKLTPAPYLFLPPDGEEYCKADGGKLYGRNEILTR